MISLVRKLNTSNPFIIYDYNLLEKKIKRTLILMQIEFMIVMSMASQPNKQMENV